MSIRDLSILHKNLYKFLCKLTKFLLLYPHFSLKNNPASRGVLFLIYGISVVNKLIMYCSHSDFYIIDVDKDSDADL